MRSPNWSVLIAIWGEEGHQEDFQEDFEALRSSFLRRALEILLVMLIFLDPSPIKFVTTSVNFSIICQQMRRRIRRRMLSL